MNFPPLHACYFCGLEVNLKGATAVKLVLGWVKGPNWRTIVRIENEEFKYCHDFCLVSKPENESLF